MMNPVGVALMDPEGDALGQSLLALKGSLEVQQRSTGDVLSILEKVDDRLASLERHMAPIRRVTEQLTTAEKNVIGSYDAMKKVHDNFRVLSEADAVLRKGLAPPSSHRQATAAGGGDGDDMLEGDESHHHHGGQQDDEEDGELQPPGQQGLDGGEEREHEAAASLGAYLEAMDRVQEAMRFLRRNARMRSAEVTLRQLELKQQKLLADMREEVYRVLVARSRCALALAPGGAGGGVDYQAGDPIPPSAARRVRALLDSLLRAGDTRWAEQAYVKARRAKLDGALKPFLERQQQVLFGGKGRDGAAASVLGERDRAVSGIVAEDALGVTTTVGRGSVSVRVASTVVGSGPEGEWVRYLQFIRELVKAEDTLFQRALPGSHHPAACTAAHLDVLAPTVAKACAEAAEAVEALVAKERARPGEKALLLVALVRGAKKEMPPLEKLLKGLSSSAPSAPTGGSSSSSSRPVSMALAAVGPSNSGGHGPWEQVTKLYHTLCRLAIAALGTLAEEVANDPSGASARNLPPSATVHVVTSNTLRTFKRLMAHEEAFTELSTLGLVPALPWEAPDEGDDAEEEEDDGANRHLRAYAAHLFMSLLKNLRAKADAYARLGEGGVDALSQAGRPHLFLMNNAHYMITTVRGSSGAAAAAAASNATDELTNIRSGGLSLSPRAAAGGAFSASTNAGGFLNSSMKRAGSMPIATALSEAFLDRLAAVVTESRAKFLAAVWGALAGEVKATDLPLEFQKSVVPGQPQQLTFESGRLIKARFAAFNEKLEALYPCQKAFAVPDAALRGRLREEAKAAVLPGYTAFFEKYGAMQFSKKHMEQYLRFPPATVASMIEELYAG